MSFSLDLFDGLVEQLADVDAPLYLGALPADGTGIGVQFYDVEPPEGTTDTVQGIQLLIRHEDPNDRRSTLRLADTVFDRLHDQTLTTWGRVPVNRAWRNSSTDLGTDESRLTLRSDNYYVRVSRTGTHLTDS